MGRAERLIRTGDDPVLKQVCEPVAPGEHLTFLDDMRLVCRKLNGAGLAAPQIGVSKRVIYLASASGGPAVFMINLRILECHGPEISEDEGCLSFPGVIASVKRWHRIRFEYEDERRAKRYGGEQGFRARVIQHEVDHLDGICRVGDAARSFSGRAVGLLRRAVAAAV